VVLTGFDTKKSTQLRVNKPLPGPDGWIYLASGLSGGRITNPARPDLPPLDLKTDLRFHPGTGEYEAVDGRSQFGHDFDAWGNRFICMNRVPVQHVVLSSRVLRRNPNLAFSDTVQDCSAAEVQSVLRGDRAGVRLFPISQNITTADAHAGSFSAACAITFWRGQVFSCDPTANLVHVDHLEPRGSTFAAVPVYAGREFLASRDDWFRPVYLARGPMDALYVADMTRKVIEHPDYLPEEARKHTDFESGKALGRIWRVRSRSSSWPSVGKSWEMSC
jgi:putative membrane-bound dehydrogenase-like protein